MSERAQFKLFKSTMKSWEALCTEAADFASQVGRDNLISIAHSEDHNDGVIIVWFWTDRSSPEPVFRERNR